MRRKVEVEYAWLAIAFDLSHLKCRKVKIKAWSRVCISKDSWGKKTEVYSSQNTKCGICQS